jgi:hypothetical protein
MQQQNVSSETRKMAAKFLGQLMLDKAKKSGRSGDTDLGHLTPGDIPFPAEKVTPEIKEELKAVFRKAGLNMDKFTVGNKAVSRNPGTGLQEFMDSGVGGGGSGPGDSAGDSSGAAGGGATGAPGSGQNPGAPQGPGDPGAIGANPGASVANRPDATDPARLDLSVHQQSNNPGLSGLLGSMKEHFGFNTQMSQGTTETAVDPGQLVGSLANLALGMIPGMGIPAAINSLSNAFGGPTVGGGIKGAMNSAGSTAPGTPGPVGGGAGQGGADNLAQNIGISGASPLNISSILAQQSPSALAGRSIINPPPQQALRQPLTEQPAGSRAVSGFERLP